MTESKIIIVEQPNGLIASSLEDESIFNEKGYGHSFEDSVTDLIYKYKTSLLQTDEEKYNLFLEEKRPIARTLFSALLPIMFNNWFSLKQLENKCNEPKEQLVMKLRFLHQFGFVITDREAGAGMRFKLIATTEKQVEIFESRIALLEKEQDILRSQIEAALQNKVDAEKEKEEFMKNTAEKMADIKPML
jgi:hypothetical protein